MDSLEIGVQPSIIKYLYAYWFLFLAFGVVVLIYDLIIHFIRHDILGRLYTRIRCYGGLRFMTIVAEIYYVFDKLFKNLSLGMVRYGFTEDNDFRRYRGYGFISILDSIKSLIMKMFVIDPYNMVIWITMYTYFNHGWFYGIYNNFVATDYNVLLSSISFTKIKNLLEQISAFWWLMVTLVSGYGIYLQVSKKIAEEKLKKALEYQEKIEQHLSEIVYLSEKNINALGLQIEYFPDYYCQLVTDTDKYLIQGRRLVSTKSYSMYHIITIETLVSYYYSYTDEIKKITDILENIENEGLRAAFKRINKPVMYEVVRLGLYSAKSFKHIGEELLEKEYMRQFLQNWTDEHYLTEKFEGFKNVWLGHKSKSLYEKEFSTGHKLSFDFIVKFAEKDLEKKALQFSYTTKSILSDAIQSHIIAEQYLKKIHSRKKTNTLLLKLDTLFSK